MDPKNDDKILTARNFEVVTSFMPFFEQEDNGNFYRVSNDLIDPFSYADEVDRFLKTLYHEGFIVHDFDWGSWINEVGIEYLKNKDIIRNADFPTIQKMLTTIVRGDRFNSGTIKEMIDDGIIVAILRRLEEIGKDPLASGTKQCIRE